jgi:hypothetical protein
MVGAAAPALCIKPDGRGKMMRFTDRAMLTA